MSNPWKVDIKDFQSLSKVHLDIEDGITIITGKTNTGKSAVIRAIDAALFNMGDDSMVKGGKRYSGVSIDNGTHKMMFCRDSHGKNEKTAYQFDGGTVRKKVGRSQLPEVAQMFNIRDVRMQNGTKMKLNFWYQNDKPFLMDKTSGQLYEFLSLSSCDRYTRVLKKMVVDMKVQEADINNITTEIDTLKSINNRKNTFIQRNNGFDDLYVKIVTADQDRRCLDDIGIVINRTRDVSSKIEDSSNRLRIVSKRFSSIPMDRLTTCYDNVLSDGILCDDLIRYIEKVKSLGARIDSVEYDRDKTHREYEDVSGMENYFLGKVDTLQNTSIILDDIGNVLNRLHSIGEMVREKKDRVDSLSSKLSVNLEHVQVSMDEMYYVSDSINILSDILFSIKSVEDKISAKKEYLSEIDIKIEANNSELESLKELAGYCPFCGTIFEKHD